MHTQLPSRVRPSLHEPCPLQTKLASVVPGHRLVHVLPLYVAAQSLHESPDQNPVAVVALHEHVPVPNRPLLHSPCPLQIAPDGAGHAVAHARPA